ESWALPSLCRATPSATSERFLGLIDSRQSLRLRRFLRFLSTEAPLLDRHYPASSLIRASPSPQTARPVSHELPVDRQRRSPLGLPVLLLVNFCMLAVAITPAGLMELVRSYCPISGGHPDN